jgi:hypothetical protein
MKSLNSKGGEMVTRELIKQEIDKIDETYLDLVFNLLRVFELSAVEKKNNLNPNPALNTIYSFYDSLAFDMSNFHFNREEANDR